MKLSIVQEKLSKKFSSLGQLIARHPFYFIAIPIIISAALLLTGLLRIKVNREADILFTAENEVADQTTKLIDKMFPTNTSKVFDVARIIRSNGFIMLYIIPKEKQGIFQESVIKDTLLMENMIKNVTVDLGNKSYGYNQLCGKKDGRCVESNFFEVAEKYKEIKTGRYKIKYPLDINNFTLSVKEYMFSLGGVQQDEFGYVTDATAARLVYAFDISDERKGRAIELWKTKVQSVIQNSKFDNIDIIFFSKELIIEELKYLTDRLIPLMPLIVIIILLFGSLSLMTDDCLRSKPWLGLSAGISAALAVGSGFGFVFQFGIGYMDYLTFLIYSILVIEIDDAFVMVAAWRKTNPENNVEKRLSDAFSFAGVSVTATSITNFTSLCIGITSPFPIIRTFCIYGAASMFFTYLYQMTFFGACMALSGYREERLLHPFCCICTQKKKRIVLPESDAVYTEFFMKQFRDKLGNLLTLKPAKVFVILLFIVNLMTGLYGLWYLKFGNVVTDLFSYNSMATKSAEYRFKYFSRYDLPFHLIIDEPINYADREVQNSIEDILQKYEAHPNIADSSLRVSWLKYYKHFANMPIGKFLLRGYNMSNKQEFIDGLRNVFLRFPRAEDFKQDISFNENFTDIIASRFLLVPTDVDSEQKEVTLTKDIKTLTELSPISMKMYSFTYRHVEQAIIINKETIKTGVIAASLVCAISVIFLSNISYAVCVALVVSCVIFEVIGYMSLWDVKIDLLFLSCFVLCIGFSINHPTHITFSFILSKALNPNGRIQNALYEIGFPVVQGTLSTVLGILILAFQPFYITVAGVKLICLFAVQTSFHSIFVVPVLLNIIDNIHIYITGKSENDGIKLEFDINELDEASASSGEHFVNGREDNVLNQTTKTNSATRNNK